MNGGLFSLVGMLAALFAGMEWPKLRTKPRRDKAAFFGLLTIVMLLSLLNLEEVPGPAQVLKLVFLPIKDLLDPG